MRRFAALRAACAALGALHVAYAGSYAGVRLTHRLVHTSFWISEEGLDGHHAHAIIAPLDLVGGPTSDHSRAMQTVFAPWIGAELFIHRHLRP